MTQRYISVSVSDLGDFATVLQYIRYIEGCLLDPGKFKIKDHLRRKVFQSTIVSKTQSI